MLHWKTVEVQRHNEIRKTSLQNQLLLLSQAEKKQLIWKDKGFQMDQFLISFTTLPYNHSCGKRK